MTPRRSSVGWFGCSRTDSRPGRPIVDRNAVTTEHLLATRTRSWLPISLLTAATISGVNPQATAARSSPGGLVGEQPVAQFADRHRSQRGERLGSVLAVDQPRHVVEFPGDQRLARGTSDSATSARHHCAATRSSSDLAATAGEFVAGPTRRRPRQQLAQIGERVRPARQAHRVPGARLTAHGHPATVPGPRLSPRGREGCRRGRSRHRP